MSTTPKVTSARVVPWKGDHGLFGVEVAFEGGRKIAFPVGDRAAAEVQARRAQEVPAFAETVWARADHQTAARH